MVYKNVCVNVSLFDKPVWQRTLPNTTFAQVVEDMSEMSAISVNEIAAINFCFQLMASTEKDIAHMIM